MNYEVKSATEASIKEIFYDKNTNKLSYKNEYGIITILEGVQPGLNTAVEYIEVASHSELVNMILGGTLQTGSWYRFPYQSVNFIHGWEAAASNLTYPVLPSYNAREVNVGPVEYLIGQAVSETNLSPIVYSESYAQDILTYLPYVDKLGTNINIYNGGTLPNATPIANFDLQWDGTNVYFDMPTGYPVLLGHYLYLYAGFQSGMTVYSIDGVYEPVTPEGECQYPSQGTSVMPKIKLENNNTRVILEGLTFADYNSYQADSLYVEHVYALEDAYGWVTKRIDLNKNIEIPFDFRNHKFRRYEMNLSVVNPVLTTDYWGYAPTLVLTTQGVSPVIIPVNTTGNYKDYTALNLTDDLSYNVKVKGVGGPDANYFLGVTDNFVFFGNCHNNDIADGFFYNTMASAVQNTIGSLCSRNICGSSFELNSIGYYFTDNLIGSNFYSNNIGPLMALNNISDNFVKNNIKDLFQNNYIKDNFTNNTLGSIVVSNTIAEYFEYNYSIGNFQINLISANCYNNRFNNTFHSNTLAVTGSFQKNTIDNIVTLIDFSSATHVYGDYNCTIFLNSAASLRLSYINGADTVIYTTVNS